MIPLSSQSLSLLHIAPEDTLTSLSLNRARVCVCECVRACVRLRAEADVDIFQFTCCTCGDVAPSRCTRWHVRVHGCVQSAELILSVICHASRGTPAPPSGTADSRSTRSTRDFFSTVWARPVKSGGANLSRRLRRRHGRVG